MVNKSERARQFLPFDALKGFKEAIKEKQRIVVNRKELTEDTLENLSYKFNQIKEGTIITIIHYDKFEYIKTVSWQSIHMTASNRSATAVHGWSSQIRILLDSFVFLIPG